MGSYVFSFPGLGKVATIIVGLVVVAVGLHAHYESAWIKNDFYKICILDRIHSRFYNESCPPVSMERFYVAVVLICFIVSIIGFILSCAVLDPYATVFCLADLVFHVLSSILLLIAGIVYIVSAVQINNHPIIGGDRQAAWLPPSFRVYDASIFLNTEKIIAGVLTMFLSLVYLCVVFSIRRGKGRNSMQF